jgi:hypothetical protein
MASKSQNTGVGTKDGTEGTIQPLTPFQRMIRTMQMDATTETEDARFSGDDLNAILLADSDTDLWESDERGPLNAQHLAGCELQLLDVLVKFSRGGSSTEGIKTPFITSDGKKMYLLVTAVRVSDAGEKTHLRMPAIGEVFQFNTSARFLATKIWAFYMRGKIDKNSGKYLECVIRETDLGDGQGVLKLRPMPKRVVRTVSE